MTKTERVLRLLPGQRHHYSDGEVTIGIGIDLGDDLGHPTEITVTIEPGDRLNDDG